MIDQNSQYNQLPNELDSVFSELKVNKHPRQAGIKNHPPVVEFCVGT